MSTEPATPIPAKPARRSPLLIMRIAIVLLALSQCLPFSGSFSMILERSVSSDRGYTDRGWYHQGKEQYVTGDQNSGFELHKWALPILLAMAAVFFTGLRNRPGWNRWVYWAATFLALSCSELPPPLSTSGGLLGALCLIMMGYAAYQNSQTKKETV